MDPGNLRNGSLACGGVWSVCKHVHVWCVYCRILTSKFFLGNDDQRIKRSIKKTMKKYTGQS